MARKPVAPAGPPPEPPEGLSESSSALWRELVPNHAKSPGRLALLETALMALDRAREVREILHRDGLLVDGGKLKHVHPLVRVERDALAAFSRCWGLLGLAFDHKLDGGQSSGW